MFIDALDIISAFDPLFRNAANRKIFARAYCPAVKEVIDNKPTTIVKFADGSKSVVKCSENDEYNLETAVIYALVKRTFCTKLEKDGEAVCPGLGNSLRKIVENAKVAKTAVGYKEPKKITCCCDCKPKKTSKIAAALEEPSDESDWDKPVTKKPVKKTTKKSFKDMTQEEKRAYWREQKRKAREVKAPVVKDDDDNDYNW